jgi:hypothetical protein
VCFGSFLLLSGLGFALTAGQAAFFIGIGVVMGGPTLAIGWYLLRGNRVVFDCERQELRHRRRTWPLAGFGEIVLGQETLVGSYYSPSGESHGRRTATAWVVVLMPSPGQDVEPVLVHEHTNIESVRRLAEELSALTGLALRDMTPDWSG